MTWGSMVWPQHREYILPKRTPEEFEAEGKAQAEWLQAYISYSDTVLDYGVGVGRVLKHIQAERRIGVDVSTGFLKEAKRHGIEPILTAGHLIALPDDSVDFLYSLMVFQHMGRRWVSQAVSELARVLKPGGRGLLQFPRLESYYQDPEYVFTREEMLGYAKLASGQLLTGDLVSYYDGPSSEGREWFLWL